MDFINPHYFAAILDGVSHRFILVQECESVVTAETGIEPPRFSVGAVNAMRDPRFAPIKQLLEVGVTESALTIPQGWLMAHQYIYLVHDNTDPYGWQYRSQWPPYGPPGPKDEQWSKSMKTNSQVRRRIWMTTIVAKEDLVRVKRLLCDNIRVDHGTIKLQGELFRYESGTLSKSWQRRRVVLHHDRVEFYSGSSKKGEISLNDCEVRMLFENQCPGKNCAFSIRNSTGTVGILLDAENKDTRRDWVLAIQYQLAINTPDLNYVPLEYGPPTGTYPDNRVNMCGDLKMKDKEGREWLPRHFQLLPREVVYYEQDQLRGRIFVEEASLTAEDRSLNFSITSASGISLKLTADSSEAKNLWLLGVRRQVQSIENRKAMFKTMPKEEAQDPACTPLERIAQFYEDNWSAPPVEGEDEDYLDNVFKAPYRNNPEHYEFSQELRINLDPRTQANHPPPPPPAPVQPPAPQPVVEEPRPPLRQLPSMKSTKSFLNVFQPQVKLLDPKRKCVNPRFMLAALKGVTHRFVLVLECEARQNAPKAIADIAPPRFTVGGARASKDPRSVPLSQLIRISQKSPEVQLPTGWFMLHPYVYITQQNTDDNGWQYRSTWSDGAIAPNEEEWVDTCDEEKMVRRRLWMVTVVKRDDLIKAKIMATDELNSNLSPDPVLQETLHMYLPEHGGTPNAWQRRKVVLLHNKLEYYNGNDKRGEISLEDCEVNMLVGKENNMDRQHAFAVTHPSGSVKLIFDADSKEMRLRWVKAITYQIAIISPDLNFQPFLYGPPTGELPQQRVLLGSTLLVKSADTGAWEEFFVHLYEEYIQIFVRETLSGRLLLGGAAVKSDEGDGDFTVRGVGLTAQFRAKSTEEKIAWIRAIKRQAIQLELKKQVAASKNNGLGDSNRSMSSRDRAKYFLDDDWAGQEAEFREDDDYIKLLKERFDGNLKQFWASGATTMSSSIVTSATPFSSSSSTMEVHSVRSAETIVPAATVDVDTRTVSSLTSASESRSIQQSTTTAVSSSTTTTSRIISQQSISTVSQMSFSSAGDVQTVATTRSAPSVEEYSKITLGAPSRLTKLASSSDDYDEPVVSIAKPLTPTRASSPLPAQAASTEAQPVVSSPPVAASAQQPAISTQEVPPAAHDSRRSAPPVVKVPSTSSDDGAVVVEDDGFISSDEESQPPLPIVLQTSTPRASISPKDVNVPPAIATSAPVLPSPKGGSRTPMTPMSPKVKEEKFLQSWVNPAHQDSEDEDDQEEVIDLPPDEQFNLGGLSLSADGSEHAHGVASSPFHYLRNSSSLPHSHSAHSQSPPPPYSYSSSAAPPAAAYYGHSSRGNEDDEEEYGEEEVHEYTVSEPSDAVPVYGGPSSARVAAAPQSAASKLFQQANTASSQSMTSSSFQSQTMTSNSSTMTSSSSSMKQTMFSSMSTSMSTSTSTTSHFVQQSSRTQTSSNATSATSFVSSTLPMQPMVQQLPPSMGLGIPREASRTPPIVSEEMQGGQSPVDPVTGLSLASSFRKSSFRMPPAEPVRAVEPESLQAKEQLRKTGFLELDTSYLTVAEQEAFVHKHERGRSSITEPQMVPPKQLVKLRTVNSSEAVKEVPGQPLASPTLAAGSPGEADDSLSPFKGVKLRHVERPPEAVRETVVRQEDQQDSPAAPFLKNVRLRSIKSIREVHHNPSTEGGPPSPDSFHDVADAIAEESQSAVKSKIRRFESRPSLTPQRSMSIMGKPSLPPTSPVRPAAGTEYEES